MVGEGEDWTHSCITASQCKCITVLTSIDMLAARPARLMFLQSGNRACDIGWDRAEATGGLEDTAGELSSWSFSLSISAVKRAVRELKNVFS